MHTDQREDRLLHFASSGMSPLEDGEREERGKEEGGVGGREGGERKETA